MKSMFLMLMVVCMTSAFTSKSAAYSEGKSKSGISSIPMLGGAYLVFAGKRGGVVSKNDIGAQRELAVEGCAKGSRIFKFTLQVTKGGQMSSYKADSNVLTTEMETKLKSLGKGDSFEFVEIKAYLPGGKEVVNVWGEKFVVG